MTHPLPPQSFSLLRLRLNALGYLVQSFKNPFQQFCMLVALITSLLGYNRNGFNVEFQIILLHSHSSKQI